MSKTQRQPRKTKAQWQAIVTDFHQSNLPSREYCQEQGLAYGTFAKWRQRLAKEAHQEKAPNVIELIAPASVAQSKPDDWQVELSLGNGMTLRVRTA